MIGIVDYGMGNLLSVKNALLYLGEDCQICEKPEDLIEVDKIILPGVGAFPDSVSNLKSKGFVEVLNRLVLNEKKPILGICLGMQVMASYGTEMGGCDGLGWFDATVKLIEPQDSSIKVPNVGWENIVHQSNGLYNGLRENLDFYFVHSYYMDCNNVEDVKASYICGAVQVTASVQKENIFGTQFHPEKSGDFGRELIINFLDL